MAIQKFLGWAPDGDPTTPGIVTDCEMLEPSIRGMKAAPSAAVTDLPALSAACTGAALVRKLDGTRRLIAGTATGLFEAGSGSWADVSAATYTGSTWEFAQFGDVTIAVNGADDPQTSSSGTFAAATAIPSASLIAVSSGFVMVANVADASYAHPDGWWCSALYDYTDWTPAIATQSARGRLLDTPGAITALKPLGDVLVAFKERSMYVGQYVGPDVIWAWSAVPGDVGSASSRGVVSDGTALYFWGGDDFYRFDGSRPQPIGEAVKRWFAENSDPQYLYLMAGSYDRAQGVIRWHFVPASGTTPTKCIVLNPKTGQWGRADRSIEALVDYVSGGFTYDSGPWVSPLTYDTIGTLPSYDSPFWLARSEFPAIFDTTHTLRSLSGVAGSSSLTTGDIGDDDTYSLLRRVRPRYSTSPASASLTAYYKQGAGDDLTTGDTVSADDGKFDVLQSARWHRVKFAWTGAVEVSGMTADLQAEGER